MLNRLYCLAGNITLPIKPLMVLLLFIEGCSNRQYLLLLFQMGLFFAHGWYF